MLNVYDLGCRDGYAAWTKNTTGRMNDTVVYSNHLYNYAIQNCRINRNGYMGYAGENAGNMYFFTTIDDLLLSIISNTHFPPSRIHRQTQNKFGTFTHVLCSRISPHELAASRCPLSRTLQTCSLWRAVVVDSTPWQSGLVARNWCHVSASIHRYRCTCIRARPTWRCADPPTSTLRSYKSQVTMT